MADAVAVEPVSTAGFPANREKNREFSVLWRKPQRDLNPGRRAYLISLIQKGMSDEIPHTGCFRLTLRVRSRRGPAIVSSSFEYRDSDGKGLAVLLVLIGVVVDMITVRFGLAIVCRYVALVADSSSDDWR